MANAPGSFAAVNAQGNNPLSRTGPNAGFTQDAKGNWMGVNGRGYGTGKIITGDQGSSYFDPVTGMSKAGYFKTDNGQFPGLSPDGMVAYRVGNGTYGYMPSPQTGTPVWDSSNSGMKPGEVYGATTNGAVPQNQGANPMKRTTRPGMDYSPANGSGGGGDYAPPAVNFTGNPGSSYAFDPQKYLDPSMDWETQQGLRALGSSVSAGGQTFAGNTLKDILDYSQGRARTNWNQAAQTAAQQQGFNRGVDVSNTQLGQSQQQINNQKDQFGQTLDYTRQTGNRAFDYQAQLNDQTIPWQQQYQMAQLGLQGQGQQSTLAGVLASILGQNYNSMGQAQGAGTIGGNNSLTSAISQILASMGQNNLYNRIPGLNN